MISLILKKAAYSIGLLFVLSFLVFSLLYFLPGDVTSAMFSRPEAMSQAMKAQILANLGLDKSLITQYFSWLKNALSLDFGKSFVSGEDIYEMFKTRLVNSIILLIFASFFIFVFSLILGLLSAVFKNKFVDTFINLTTFSLMCMPNFWLGLIFIYVFSIALGLLPSSGANYLGVSGISLKHVILPIFAIVLPHLATSVKFIRDIIISNLNTDFIQTLYARGIKNIQIYRLAVFSSMSDIVRYFGTMIGGVFAGSYVIESVFSYPGIGELALKSIIAKDYPVVLAAILLSAIFVILANLAAEIIAILIDKRNYAK